VGLEFFERVGSDDKLYDFIVEADPVKAIGSDRFARDFRSFRRHSEKGSSALVEMMAPWPGGSWQQTQSLLPSR
jgi:hypothetical protein